MSSNVLLLLQAILVFFQMANAAFDSLPAPYPVLIAAAVGALQFYVNHLGNQTVPPGIEGGK